MIAKGDVLPNFMPKGRVVQRATVVFPSGASKCNSTAAPGTGRVTRNGRATVLETAGSSTSPSGASALDVTSSSPSPEKGGRECTSTIPELFSCGQHHVDVLPM
eukprot:CAMPEP_0194508938 /NCGR_PEP_ID=MMETSP0253-20130528/39266_1 /TAXON_ID=2966 /ORGANISM="Noctiluca scintillans" /LENGTH=103 /DNA_ID=CAMNT_0039352017 /DNA_START=197 /DNA_END=505 /DNA_ORIENTATION=+